ncbi:ribulose-5-phosphate 4-epimerase/fuculose-1-phosphate aldolase [Bradyrhizobium macuxiense]|uniref:Ribulose-5-phosphate 4-epimerase/fuculose-1-phosphate aldolase n=1 Tax=Bradyrhizobium macuxiense TaxID=1755647 RepID=A0A560KS45_9BRAD|nr:class II aldolase/adducin family protein [Bradyrhizobium macuxiense]TWB86042.1 ribulose-5-phosphate 4-epimerase/fuculose-1-phosphate aldolase [Bradyrhizobium macuxiense]
MRNNQMNILARSDAGNPDIEAAQRQTRIDLAAAHRLAVMHGFHEGIFNHFTTRVPGHSDRYYQIPFGLHWTEVTAACFMEVGYDGLLHVGEGVIEPSCYHIHAPIHKLVPHADTVLHCHMPFTSALARLEDQSILPIGGTELRMMMHTGYDNEYHSTAFTLEEGVRLANLIGDKEILIMANHGVSIAATSVAKAYDLLYYIERAAQVQLYAMWTGRPLKVMPENVVRRSTAEYGKGDIYGGRDACDWHFDALKRILDEREPDYKT